MTNCHCGTPVRLRVIRVSVNRKRGVAHWIEHEDGTAACGAPNEWSCVALKPYPKDESQREYAKLKARWESHLLQPVGGR